MALFDEPGRPDGVQGDLEPSGGGPLLVQAVLRDEALANPPAFSDLQAVVLRSLAKPVRVEVV